MLEILFPVLLLLGIAVFCAILLSLGAYVFALKKEKIHILKVK